MALPQVNICKVVLYSINCFSASKQLLCIHPACQSFNFRWIQRISSYGYYIHTHLCAGVHVHMCKYVCIFYIFIKESRKLAAGSGELQRSISPTVLDSDTAALPGTEPALELPLLLWEQWPLANRVKLLPPNRPKPTCHSSQTIFHSLRLGHTGRWRSSQAFAYVFACTCPHPSPRGH